MHILLVVHPIDIVAHSTIPPGYRWAVMFCQQGNADLTDMSRCLNAGYAASQLDACLFGEAVQVAVVKALHMVARPCDMSSQILDHDPIPSGGDVLTTIQSRLEGA